MHGAKDDYKEVYILKSEIKYSEDSQITSENWL